MTIARDIHTGEIVGQVTVGSLYGFIRLLTKDGYVTVPASTVTLEKVS